MKISKEYGPQLDPEDGTCGETKLVKRYVIVDDDGCTILPQQGRNTWEHRKDAEHYLKLLRENNSKKYGFDTAEVVPCWCWPNHFDPAIACTEKQIQEDKEV